MRKEDRMSIESLKCKECGTTYELDASYFCENCFGPLEVAYDYSALDAGRGEAADPGRLAGDLALRRLPPLRGPPRRPAGAGPDAAGARRPPGRAARRSRPRSGSRTTPPTRPTPSRTGSSPSPSPRPRSSASRPSPAPRPATSPTPSPPTPPPPGSTPTSSSPPTSRSRSCSRPASTGPTWSASAATTTTSTGSAPSWPRPAPGPSSTSTCAPTTPRARRRSPTRRSSSSAGSCRTGSSARSPRARSSPSSAAASRSGSTSAWSRASSRSSTAPRREGCSPVATAFAEGWDVCKPQKPETIAKSLAIGDPADGPYAVEHARRTGGGIDSVTDDEIREGIRLLAETTGIFTETAGGVTVGVLKKLAERGEIGAGERVVVYITGEGLKTLDATRDTFQMHEIDPDLDSFEAEFRQEVAV